MQSIPRALLFAVPSVATLVKPPHDLLIRACDALAGPPIFVKSRSMPRMLHLARQPPQCLHLVTAATLAHCRASQLASTARMAKYSAID
ncbi:hypothetical protein PtA15_8A228 [Puccinia triticina]|uniref:Secreted protein n=1 Tax=Puccinia triticina TaxID=208348 RepID=A0ABY7CRP0_9BASI|nr:uncharacterized protein PtA15_8A228 [Puccinia triticina]WAQ87324.1 hypothetical protein PtA15_8A228 [Puccinia triticina]